MNLPRVNTFDSAGSRTIPATDAAEVRDYIALLKPRVMSLVVFTGLVGLYLAPGGLHPVIGFIAVLCIAVGAGASGAINMWYDRDIDAVMSRTMNRPIPGGRVTPENALTFGVLLAAGSVALMGVAVNLVAALLLAATIAFYVFVYTMWLKRRTPQNIVIGGAAGALPPVVGWAAVTGSVDVLPLLLFGLIFMWTPPHFWALALYRAGDYERAGVPMLPVVAGKAETRRQIVLYAALMAVVAISPWILGLVWHVYGVVAVLLSLVFVGLSLSVYRYASDRPAKRLFGFSIFYLFGLFLALVADKLIAGWVL